MVTVEAMLLRYLLTSSRIDTMDYTKLLTVNLPKLSQILAVNICRSGRRCLDAGVVRSGFSGLSVPHYSKFNPNALKLLLQDSLLTKLHKLPMLSHWYKR